MACPAAALRKTVAKTKDDARKQWALAQRHAGVVRGRSDAGHNVIGTLGRVATISAYAIGTVAVANGTLWLAKGTVSNAAAIKADAVALYRSIFGRRSTNETREAMERLSNAVVVSEREEQDAQDAVDELADSAWLGSRSGDQPSGPGSDLGLGDGGAGAGSGGDDADTASEDDAPDDGAGSNRGGRASSSGRGGGPKGPKEKKPKRGACNGPPGGCGGGPGNGPASRSGGGDQPGNGPDGQGGSGSGPLRGGGPSRKRAVDNLVCEFTIRSKTYRLNGFWARLAFDAKEKFRSVGYSSYNRAAMSRWFDKRLEDAGNVRYADRRANLGVVELYVWYVDDAEKDLEDAFNELKLMGRIRMRVD